MTLKKLPRPGLIMLRLLADELRREFAAAHRLDGQLVDRDIAARRHEAAGGRLWANQRERIQRQLENLGITEGEWCKRELDCDIATMRRRVQLAKGWDQYEQNRRSEGNNGQYGLYYALSLIRVSSDSAMTTVESTADSGRAKRRLICPDCGIWIGGMPTAGTWVPDMVRVIRAGTLDDTSWVRPTVHFWTRSRQPWVLLPDGDQRY
jgi:hypothetical protein